MTAARPNKGRVLPVVVVPTEPQSEPIMEMKPQPKPTGDDLYFVTKPRCPWWLKRLYTTCADHAKRRRAEGKGYTGRLCDVCYCP